MESTKQCCSDTSIMQTSSVLTLKDRMSHFQARWGIRRDKHRVAPGLYRLGDPDKNSPVFVTANYTLSFDALRSNVPGVSAYILVLDTFGINVWCAAGKGTFSTEELIRQIEATQLKSIVTHRNLILPQLGAPGVSAHTVRKDSGFKVNYGPVRAEDLAEYLSDGKATLEMRRVQFTFRDRAVLIPVEISMLYFPFLIAAVSFYFIGGWLAVTGIVAAGLTGVVVFPLLLPVLPFRNFSVNGFFMGAFPAVILASIQFSGHADLLLWKQIGVSLPYLLGIPAVTAYLALNFTGSTTFTSPTGVRKEIYRYIPRMGILAGTALLLTILFIILI